MISQTSPNSEIRDKLLSSAFSHEEHNEGYNIQDPNYLAWLRIHHHNSVCSITCSSSVSVETDGSSLPSPNLNPVATCTSTPQSLVSVTSVSMCSSSSSKALSEVLTLPEISLSKPSKRKRKPALNSKSVLVTDTDVYEGLKQKEHEKVEKEAMKKDGTEKTTEERRERTEKERNGTMKERKGAAKERSKQQKRGRKKENKVQSKERDILKSFEAIAISDEQNTTSSDSEAQCPKCGLLYGEDESLWICCDGCNSWYDLKAHKCVRHPRKLLL